MFIRHLLLLLFHFIFLVGFAICETQFFENLDAFPDVKSGQTWGMSWGYLNDDNYPDLFISRHGVQEHPLIYWNKGYERGIRSFVDIQAVLLGNEYSKGAKRTSAWFDFDNDGVQDLFVARGGAREEKASKNSKNPLMEPNWLFKSHGSFFTEEADIRGLATESYAPLFVDFDDDGHLDLFLTSTSGGSTAFKQVRAWGGATFVNTSKEFGIPTHPFRLAQLADLNEDGRLDLILLNINGDGFKGFDTKTKPFDDLTSKAFNKTNSAGHKAITDAVFADFDNDLSVDMFLIEPCNDAPLYVQHSQRVLEFSIATGIPDGETEQQEWIKFYTYAEFTIKSDRTFRVKKDSYSSKGDQKMRHLVLEITTETSGKGNGTDKHVWSTFHNISRSSNGQWVIEVESETSQLSYFIIDSTSPIRNITTSKQTNEVANKPSPLYIKNMEDGSLEQVVFEGYEEVCGVSVVAADFDNDMDVDIFVLRNSIMNSAKNHTILWNQGNGTFTVDHMAAGAVEANHYRPESVTTVDFNIDGHMDITITSGDGPDMLKQGSYGLFQNRGSDSDNNWIELRLTGAGKSNRDAIGAWIVATTLDGVQQYRARDGGMHRRSQNSGQIHFGLANHTSVYLETHWPDGKVSFSEVNTVNQVVELYHPDAEKPQDPYSASLSQA